MFVATSVHLYYSWEGPSSNGTWKLSRTFEPAGVPTLLIKPEHSSHTCYILLTAVRHSLQADRQAWSIITRSPALSP